MTVTSNTKYIAQNECECLSILFPLETSVCFQPGNTMRNLLSQRGNGMTVTLRIKSSTIRKRFECDVFAFNSYVTYTRNTIHLSASLSSVQGKRFLLVWLRGTMSCPKPTTNACRLYRDAAESRTGLSYCQPQ